ncbi:mechanosensitive ion channel family protein [Helicobacter pametensis]|uniref:mechanosensitive ion channel family protein n=1 Tax=Helicobacter pametensis TaxID=95149 RepID=UPI0004AD3B33|nr:mechanosensitive ion channel domain-containing protein [Helicobacter pametensis]
MQDFFTYLFSLWHSHGSWVIHALKASVILSIGIYLAFWIRKKVKLTLSKQDEILGNFFAQASFIVIALLTIITLLGSLGIPTNSFVAVLGTIGLAIALGLKDSLSNLASGLLLVILRPFKKDDEVQIGTTKGRVKTINLFHTILITEDQSQSIIPNTNITKTTIINHAQSKHSKLSWTLTLQTQKPLQEIQTILQNSIQITKQHIKPPTVQLISIQDQTLVFHLSFWVTQPFDQNLIFQKMIELLQSQFDKIEISIKG